MPGPYSCYIEPCFFCLNHRLGREKFIFLWMIGLEMSADIKSKYPLSLFSVPVFVGAKPLPSWYHQSHHHPEHHHMNIVKSSSDSSTGWPGIIWFGCPFTLISGPLTSTYYLILKTAYWVSSQALIWDAFQSLEYLRSRVEVQMVMSAWDIHQYHEMAHCSYEMRNGWLNQERWA